MIETLSQAGKGWSGILANKDGWEHNFQLDADGLNAALLTFGASVILAMVLATLRIGFPPPDITLLLLLGHVLALAALILVTTVTRRFAAPHLQGARFLVPGIYLLAAMKVIEGIAVVVGVPLAGAILAVSGILAFRLARANGLGYPISIGYGLGLFALLAGLPIALYMLVNAL